MGEPGGSEGKPAVKTVVTRKVINAPEQAVDESLDGFVLAHPHVSRVKEHRIVVRRDVASYCASNQRVAIVAGGGSGHEPMFAGHVGKGGLTAAVAGSVFASPPVSEILTALRAVQNKVGTLLFIFNYTGDRLNFGLAVERSATAIPGNGPIRVVVVGEDTALTSPDRTAGRRGLAGGSMVMKVAGAMAEAGKTLTEIGDYIEALIKKTGTIGVSLSSCSIPGGGPLFTLAPGQMELGLGVHGEPGIERTEVLPAKEMVARMLDHMTLATSFTGLRLENDGKVAVLINNLGGTTSLEMNIICYEVAKYLESKHILVHRLFSGGHMTSLEMHGFSVSVMLVDGRVTEYLDAPSECTLYPPVARPPSFTGHSTVDPAGIVTVQADSDTSSASTVKGKKGFVSDAAHSSLLIKCTLACCQALADSEALLNQLDAEGGDGDCGSTMKRGSEAIRQIVNGYQVKSVAGFPFSTFFEDLSCAWESSTGGTSGPIYGLLFSSLARALGSGHSVGDWINGLRWGLDAVMKYGRARPGDRTLVDVLDAVLKSADQHADKPVLTLLEHVDSAAVRACEATRSMQASAGRASYVGSRTLTQPDPGAKAVVIWFEALCRVFAE